MIMLPIFQGVGVYFKSINKTNVCAFLNSLGIYNHDGYPTHNEREEYHTS